ncbi:MAG: GvpL/GvpF family gas vesicle protein [Planctomycetota bacterium]
MVAVATSAATSSYLYAITAPHSRLELSVLPGVADAGGREAAPCWISDGHLAAVASAFEGRRVRPERRNLAAHQGVLRALMDMRIPFLPVAFGVVVPSRQDLLELLAANRETILRDLERLSGKVEMGLKAAWDVPNIFEFLVFRNPELARLRDQLLKKPGGGTREEKIALGQAFEALLSEEREQHAATVMAALSACTVEFKNDPPRDEKMIVNLSCLIQRNREKAFEEAVLRAASCFDDNYAFDYSGPWPPYHFVTASLAEPVGSQLVH